MTRLPRGWYGFDDEVGNAEVPLIVHQYVTHVHYEGSFQQPVH